MNQNQDPIASAHHLFKDLFKFGISFVIVGFMTALMLDPTSYLGGKFRLIYYGEEGQSQPQPLPPAVGTQATAETPTQGSDTSIGYQELQIGDEVTDCTKKRDLFIRSGAAIQAQRMTRWPAGQYLVLTDGPVDSDNPFCQGRLRQSVASKSIGKGGGSRGEAAGVRPPPPHDKKRQNR